jgi:hypothetical protein
MLRDSYGRLEVVMFFEILSHLPATHLKAFVKMNEENEPREEIDKFFGIICQMQKEYLPMSLLNSGRFMCVSIRLGGDNYEYQ